MALLPLIFPNLIFKRTRPLSLPRGLRSLSWKSIIPRFPSLIPNFSKIKAMGGTIVDDFQMIFERDPAARNWLEVLLCYPGFQCLVLYRFAHELHQLKMPLIPRFLSHLAHFLTGIDIHPGAILGRGICIDHGMGVVIGETTIIGDAALIYQGATLGGTGKASDKRHPTLGNNVIVGAGAKVLGNLQIEDNVRIGAGAVVLENVPANSTVVGVPGRIVRSSGSKLDPLAHDQLPDLNRQWINQLVCRLEQLEEQLKTLQQEKHLASLEVKSQKHALSEAEGSKVSQK